MQSFSKQYRALVIGSSGGIGSAFLDLLQSDPNCSLAIGIHRQSDPWIDYSLEDSIEKAALALSSTGPFHLIINATGILYTDTVSPEKKLDDLSLNKLELLMRINAFGPALMMNVQSWQSFLAELAALKIILLEAGIAIGLLRLRLICS